ncbi:hypothetical protein H9W95_06360 [Flavobacterium lindanitolerans]|nr:hypothetical protein [Flavobacterium lindanitolerans]
MLPKRPATVIRAVNGTTYTTSGTYTHVTTNASGCTNTATLNLTINNSTTSSITETACDSYTGRQTERLIQRAEPTPMLRPTLPDARTPQR